MKQWLKTWGKWIGICGVGVVLVFGVLSYLLLGVFLAYSVEWAGERATGEPSTVERASIDLFNGKAGIHRLRIQNPDNPAFRENSFLEMKSGRVNMRPGSLLESVVQVPEVTIDGLHLTVERFRDRENYKIMLERLRNRLESDRGGSKGGGFKYHIHDMKVTDVQVTFSGFPGMNRTLKLADMHFENVGSEEDPFTFTRLTALIIQTVFTQLLQNPELLPGTMVAGLNEGLRGMVDLGELGVSFTGNITDKTGEVLGTVGGAAGAVVEGVGETVEGLFGGDDEEEGDEGEQKPKPEGKED